MTHLPLLNVRSSRGEVIKKVPCPYQFTGRLGKARAH